MEKTCGSSPWHPPASHPIISSEDSGTRKEISWENAVSPNVAAMLSCNSCLTLSTSVWEAIPVQVVQLGPPALLLPPLLCDSTRPCSEAPQSRLYQLQQIW